MYSCKYSKICKTAGILTYSLCVTRPIKARNEERACDCSVFVVQNREPRIELE